MKKHFNKNLIMSEEEEKQFQPSNTCWICEKPIDSDDEKERDYCCITGKFRGVAHLGCNYSNCSSMNSSLEKLVENLSDNDFKYLTEELDLKI